MTSILRWRIKLYVINFMRWLGVSLVSYFRNGAVLDSKRCVHATLVRESHSYAFCSLCLQQHRDANPVHAAGFGGLNAKFTVFEDAAVFGIYAEAFGGFDEDIRGRFTAHDVL